MSSTDAAPTLGLDTTDASTKPAEKANTESENKADNDSANQNNNKPMKKVKSKKDLKNDPSRFDPPGVNFNAKLIGIDDVKSARGDKMCQESMYRLKVAVKQSGQHKQKILINVSVDGIRIMDIRTQATNHTHAVHRISFISRDITDNRAFGYVYGAGEGKHKFYAIKTEKAAEALVLTLRDLFQTVYEMKKQEVEDAKHKVDEPATETATEAKENVEPVYQVPQNGKPVENGAEPTYEVPPNNKPVQQEEAPDLLNLENELESMERRINQIDTMEELFKELEAPPTTSPTSSATSTAWSSDLAGLSQTAPTFSVGGAPFSPTGQPFMGASNPQAGFGGQPFGQGASQPFGQAGFGGQPFGGAGQPFGGAGQPFGATGQPGQQFGAAGQPGGFGAQFAPQPGAQPGAFTAQPNPFGAPPSVPPRTGMGIPGQPSNQFPAMPFPGAPQQQQMFPGAPGVQPAMPPVSNDPFGNDPFASDGSGFGDGLLEPARMNQAQEEIIVKQEPKDAFGDLVDIGSKVKTSKTPKDLFVDLVTPEKKSLNELKVDKTPTKKSPSPVGFQASGSSPTSFENQHASAVDDPFGSSMPFGTSDPFANDPFASTAGSAPQSVAHQQDALFGGDVFGENDDDAYNIPLPQGPPPPLPQTIASPPPTHIEPQGGPPPPPRPSVNPQCTPPLPRIPPRPKSASSDSHKSSTTSINSISDIQAVNQQTSAVTQQLTPPLPPRPRVECTTMPVPRPRPRASIPQTLPSLSNVQNNNTLSDKIVKSVDTNKNNAVISNPNDKCVQNVSNISSSNDQKNVNLSHHSAKKERLKSNESQKSDYSNSSKREQRSSSVVADPFVSTDPFAVEDPFAHHADPFANDPFAPDPFSDLSDTQHTKKDDDPFTTVVASPRANEEADPFSVFDKKFLNESFKFEKSSSRKGKLKVVGQ